MNEDNSNRSHRWGMAIDLDRCTGMSGLRDGLPCGKQFAAFPLPSPAKPKGRAVHWIRVDRYYEGEFPDIRVKAYAGALPAL